MVKKQKTLMYIITLGIFIYNFSSAFSSIIVTSSSGISIIVSSGVSMIVSTGVSTTVSSTEAADFLNIFFGITFFGVSAVVFSVAEVLSFFVEALGSLFTTFETAHLIISNFIFSAPT